MSLIIAASLKLNVMQERQSSDQIGLSKIVDRLSNFVKIHATLIEKHPDKM